MPIYEYQCKACKARFEELATPDETVPCPSCKSSDTTRLISACGHQGCRAAQGSYSPSSAGGCGGCSGGNCASCH